MEVTESQVRQWPAPSAIKDKQNSNNFEFAWRKVIRTQAYMLRWGIKTPWFTIYLHRYAGGDTGEEPHNHPWTWWSSLVLRGCISERRQLPGTAPKLIKRSLTDGFTYLLGEHYHQIEHAQKGSLTLFVAGNRRRVWGFQEGWNNSWYNDADVARWEKEGADGDLNALYRIGLIAWHKSGTQNLTQAFDCFSTAAKGEHAESQYMLANAYLYGYGVQQSYENAVFWWHKAAEHGLISAQNNLGVAYSRGMGVVKDVSKGKYWYDKAAHLGNPIAVKNLNHADSNEYIS